ncbi:hypothetical protein [Laspinema olomoucense]|uniref:hypothetical protein n=1 Tax=Laspinema olomoucense TaxID=3231600 RepID=UPI0021BBB1BA|nr:hypothetical protein [Laspinema sp. D3d]MCT7972272.1 hypothetical protein [Laspinema sp. D3d]
MMRSLLRTLLVSVFFLVLYWTLVVGGVVPSSEGINQRQINQIKAERYIYSDRNPKVVLLGSSLTSELREKYFNGNPVKNIAISGGSSQTGLKLVTLKPQKPEILLVELNSTLILEPEADIIAPIQNPLLNLVKTWLPIFREEYQPVSILVSYLKNRSGGDPSLALNQVVSEDLRDKLIRKVVERSQNHLSPEVKQQITEQSQLIKQQISEIQKQGVRLILFNVPGEPKVANTLQKQEEHSLIQSLFPPDTFEWLPEPTTADWTTYDGIHLMGSDAKKFADFIIKQLKDSANLTAGIT